MTYAEREAKYCKRVTYKSCRQGIRGGKERGKVTIGGFSYTLALGVYGTHESICNTVIEIEISTYCVEVLQWRDTPP